MHPSTGGKNPALLSAAEPEQGLRSDSDPDSDSGDDEEVPANSQHVRVYCLTDDGHQDDLGRGQVIFDVEESKGIVLAVVDDEDDGTLLKHNISSDNIYRKEGVITLSADDPVVSVNDELKNLPPLELSSLPLISKTVLEKGMKDQTLVAELISQEDNFFPNLVDLFRMCEGSGNMVGLHMICRLVKGIILLNNFEMFHNIFSDDFILDIIGALEYDPEVSHVHSHRASVQKEVVFKEAIPIKNAYVASKIHQTYRIRYIKDVILPKGLDDATKASLNSIIHGNNVLIVCLLKDDASFIQDLFAKMKSSNTSAESKSKLVLFLHEFCTLSEKLPSVQRLQLSRDLVREGVFDIISDVLQSQDKVLISAGTNILSHFLDKDPDLVQCMVTGSGEAMRFRSFLMSLLDSSAAKAPTDCEVVVEVFFDKHLHKLLDVIASSSPPKGIAGSTVNFFGSNVMMEIISLSCQRETALVVAAVQFMRTIIDRKDEFLNSRVIKLNLLKPIIEAFVENGDRYNMLHSAVLDLLDYIRKEKLESLIEYAAESFWDQLVKFERLKTIHAFKPKYQQITETAKTKQSTGMVDMRKKEDERGADKEEDYVNDSSGEDSATEAMGAQKQSMPARYLNLLQTHMVAQLTCI
nr:unnamed protein product [Digitaria exilis]